MEEELQVYLEDEVGISKAKSRERVEGLREVLAGISVAGSEQKGGCPK